MDGSRAAHRGEAPPPTILVVDDERAVRDIVAELLEDEGYAVRRARDGVEALAIVAEGRIDLVLSDVKMPRLDGEALVRRLRAGGNPIPTVLMSAVVTEIDLPGCPLVPKPFDACHLLRTVAQALRAPRTPPVATSAPDGKERRGG